LFGPTQLFFEPSWPSDAPNIVNLILNLLCYVCNCPINVVQDEGLIQKYLQAEFIQLLIPSLEIDNAAKCPIHVINTLQFSNRNVLEMGYFGAFYGSSDFEFRDEIIGHAVTMAIRQNAEYLSTMLDIICYYYPLGNEPLDYCKHCVPSSSSSNYASFLEEYPAPYNPFSDMNSSYFHFNNAEYFPLGNCTSEVIELAPCSYLQLAMYYGCLDTVKTLVNKCGVQSSEIKFWKDEIVRNYKATEQNRYSDKEEHNKNYSLAKHFYLVEDFEEGTREELQSPSRKISLDPYLKLAQPNSPTTPNQQQTYQLVPWKHIVEPMFAKKSYHWESAAKPFADLSIMFNSNS